jgi:hypothetical protein
LNLIFEFGFKFLGKSMGLQPHESGKEVSRALALERG